jgi:hypothetical protein
MTNTLKIPLNRSYIRKFDGSTLCYRGGRLANYNNFQKGEKQCQTGFTQTHSELGWVPSAISNFMNWSPKERLRQTPNTSMETDAGQKGVAGQIPRLFATATPPFTQAAPSVANVFCTNCGNPVAEQAVACMSCGAKPVGHRNFCRYCAAALNPAQVVCTHCGSAISTTGTSHSVGGDTTWAYEKPPFDPTFLLISSVVITFCCCLPAGITGIIFTLMCKQDLQEGRYESAAKNSQIAFWINIGGLVGGVILLPIIIFLNILGSM